MSGRNHINKCDIFACAILKQFLIIHTSFCHFILFKYLCLLDSEVLKSGSRCQGKAWGVTQWPKKVYLYGYGTKEKRNRPDKEKAGWFGKGWNLIECWWISLLSFCNHTLFPKQFTPGLLQWSSFQAHSQEVHHCSSQFIHQAFHGVFLLHCCFPLAAFFWGCHFSLV